LVKLIKVTHGFLENDDAIVRLLTVAFHFQHGFLLLVLYSNHG